MASENIYGRSSVENLNSSSSKLRNRRRSSMSDMDKIEGLQSAKASDISLSVTSKSYENGSISTPNSPQAHYMRHMQKSDNLRGSIGDFMNLKRFGVSSGVVTESIIAKTVPLTTVTKKKSCVKTHVDDVNNFIINRSADGKKTKNNKKTTEEKLTDDRLVEDGDDSIKANRKRKCGVAFTENIIMQHIVRNSSNDVTQTKDSGFNNNANTTTTANVNNNNNGNDARFPGPSKFSDVFDTVKKSSKQSVDNCEQNIIVQNGIKKISQVPLSGSQRTERLSRIIRHHHSTHQLYANIYVSYLLPHKCS